MTVAKAIAPLTVLITGILTLAFYIVVNYVFFQDFGFVNVGRIVFASKYGYFDYLLLPLGILTGMYIYRNKSLDEITFRKLFGFGRKITIMASVLFSAFIFISLQLDTDYFFKLVDLIRQADVPGKALTTFEKNMLFNANAIEQTALFRNPLFYTIANFIVYFLLGMLSSYLFAMLLKRNKKPVVV